MNLQELDRLLENYYGGNSTENDEDRLVELLLSANLPEEYDNDVQVILGLSDSSAIPEPDNGFEARIMAGIDGSAKEEKIVSLKRKIYSAVAVAATLLIVVSSYFIAGRSGEPEDTFDDPILAYNATVEVLQQFGRNLDKGTYALSDLRIIGETENKLKELSEPAMLISKEMESLKYIKKSIDILDVGSVIEY